MGVSDRIYIYYNRLMEIGIRPDVIRLTQKDHDRLVDEMQDFANLGAWSKSLTAPQMPKQVEQYMGIPVVIDNNLPEGSVMVEGAAQ